MADPKEILRSLDTYLTVDNNNFLTPEIDDYIRDDVSLKYLQQVEQSIGDKYSTGYNAMFYINDPWTTDLGYHPDANIFVIKSTPIVPGKHEYGEKYDKLNKFDGDTVYFSMKDIKDGGNGFEIGGTKYANFREYADIHTDNYEGVMGVRFLGVDAPEIAHYSVMPILKSELEIRLIKVKASELSTLDRNKFIYDKAAERESGSIVEFVRLDDDITIDKDKWHEVVEKNVLDKEIIGDHDDQRMLHYTFIKIVSTDDSEPNGNYHKQGLIAKAKVREMLQKAQDMVIVIDSKTVIRRSGVFPTKYGSQFYPSDYDADFFEGYWNIMEHPFRAIAAWWERFNDTYPYRGLGFNAFGMDAYRRFLGVVYVKIYIPELKQSRWINLSKYVIANCDMAKILPDFRNDPELSANYSYSSDAFELWTYNNIRSGRIVDSLLEVSKGDYDDRRRIQREIIGADFEDLKDHTVMIGDCLFMVPPTSIRYVSQTVNERAPLLRARGSMTKSTPKTERMIEMTLYFNNEEGINGVPYNTKLPNGEEVTYYLNGLRSLIAMFKTTPFLPIENTYINKILNVEAVSLANIQISTLPNYPKCLAATLIMQDFNYRAYMPEIPAAKTEEDQNKNLFASTIHYETMRWYYQRAIMNGEKIKDLDFDSKEYLDATFGSKTALQPMKFEKPHVEFYIVDSEYLDTQLQLKENAEKKALKIEPVMTEGANKWAKELSALYVKLNSVLTNERFAQILSDANNHRDTLATASVFDQFFTNELVGKTSLVESVSAKIRSSSRDNHVDFYYDIGLMVSRELIPLDLDLENFLGTKAKEIDEPRSEFYDDNKIKLYIKGTFEKSINGLTLVDNFRFDREAPGYQFLQSCAGYGQYVTEEDYDQEESNEYDKISTQLMLQYSLENKQQLDLESQNSLKFVKYEIGNVYIKTLSCAFGNTMTRLAMQAFDGSAPQYAGGQDTVIEISIETMDENAVLLLNHLPTLATEYARKYRKVLSVWPIRINSEITRLLGTNEVAIESIDVNTVPNQPGLYTIDMRLISVDRTMRNREALKRIEADNAGAISNNTTTTTLVTKGYFDIKETLSEAEVYPDLELPTIEELNRKGFLFVKYSNAYRKYPDPDFYFVYGHLLGSEIFRETIINYFYKNSISNKEYDIVDRYGGLIKFKPEALSGLKITGQNQTAKLVKDNQDQIGEVIKDLVARAEEGLRDKDPENMSYGEVVNSLANADIYQGWDIAKEIKCLFREKKYETALEEKDKGLAAEIDSRSSEIIKLIDEELSRPIPVTDVDYNAWYYRFTRTDHKGQVSIAEEYFNLFAKDFFNAESVGGKIMSIMLNSEEANNKVMNNYHKFLLAAASTATGRKEYEQKFGDSDWKLRMWLANDANFWKIMADRDANHNLIPVCKVDKSGQGNPGRAQASSLTEALDYGVEFGPFAIKIYTEKELQAMTNGEANTNKPYLFLDPYYREQAPDEEILQYKNGIMLNPYYAAHAFSRLMLFWMKRMLEDKVLFALYDLYQDMAIGIIENKELFERLRSPFVSAENVVNDISPQTGPTTEQVAQTEDNENKAIKDLVEKKEQEDAELAITLKQNMEQNRVPLAYGKIFAPLFMAIASGDDSIYQLMKTKDYDTLNGLIASIAAPSSKDLGSFNGIAALKRFVCALAGFDLIKMSNIGSDGTYVSEMVDTVVNERIYMECAEDPSIYILHSFHDMVVNDKRGRMSRAFPTFYMLFIDEGREIGLWKLHDNFYNMSAISEIQVTKSRKIAADTARVVMSNMFKSYTTDDEDVKEGYEYTWKDAFNSVFSPRPYFLQEELRRLQASPVERTKLKPGVRIHIRMGYSSDASDLPIVFNGTVAEIGTGEAVEIIAQGDGVEISNPILSNTDAEDMQHEDSFAISKQWKKWTTQGATPRTILGSILTTKGGWMRKFINEKTSGRFFNANPYGIVHFGDPDVNMIFRDGEVVQNIYEAVSKPSFGPKEIGLSKIAERYQTEEAPRISTHIFGKSYWDIMHICASVSPDFISAIAPFGFRSTIFHGAPRYYYAYDYAKDDNGVVKEKRKPFQQYHIYTSYSDIIGNSIKASDMDVRTCAVGLYTLSGFMSKEGPSRVGPLWVDFDIYPEKQKTMTVDTQFIAKGSTIGNFIPFLDWIQNNIGKANSKLFQGGKAIAWRMTASALRDSIKDMYQGELVVIGDPSVKPHDRVWMEDIYNGMQGCVEVEAVVHNFSVAEGYTTSVFADCIARIDDNHEKVIQGACGDIFWKSLAVYGSTCLSSWAYGKSGRPLLNAIVGYLNKGGNIVKNMVNNISGFVGKEGLISDELYSNIVNPILKGTDLTTTNLQLKEYLDLVRSWDKSLGRFTMGNDLSDLSSAANNLDRISKITGNLDPQKTIDSLEYLKKGLDPVSDKTNIGKIDDAIKALKARKIQIDYIVKGVQVEQNYIDDIVKLARNASVDEKKIEAFAKLGGKFADGDEFKLLTDMLKSIGAVDKPELIDDAVRITEKVGGLFDEMAAGLKVAAQADDAVIAASTTTFASVGLATTALIMAAEIAFWYVMSAFVYESIERWMSSLQTVQIFPIKKDGSIYAAGLDGSKGVIVGSPSYEDPGMIEGWLADMVGPSVGPRAGVQNFLKNMFFSKDMCDLATSFRRKNNLPDPDSIVGAEKLVQDLMLSVSAEEMKNLNEFSAMLLRRRVTELGSTEGKEIKLKSTIKSNDRLEIDPALTENLIPLPYAKKIKELIDKRYLRISHYDARNETQDLMDVVERNYNTGSMLFKIESAPKEMPYIYINGVIDLPFLQPDAFYVLLELIRRLETAFEKPNSQYGAKSGFEAHPIILKSALRVNDKGWNSTGYVFRVQVKDYDKLEELLSELAQEQIQVSTARGDEQASVNTLFVSRKVREDEFDILVYPPIK